MKKKIISAIPEVFSLRGNDYSSFVVKGGADTIMRNNWKGVGKRLNNAITKVGQDVQKKQAA
jgi:hypothetical protein